MRPASFSNPETQGIGGRGPAGHRHFLRSFQHTFEFPMSHSAFVAAAAEAEAKAPKRFHSHRTCSPSPDSRPRAATAPTPMSALPPATTHDSGRWPLLLQDGALQEHLCDDLCLLCDTCLKDSSGRSPPGLQLEPPPSARRWQKLPCRCADRYLHVTCLEAAFFESGAVRGGRRRLRIACPACAARLRVTRRRERRACDHRACLSFARHLVSVLLIVAFLVTFGLWSMFRTGDWVPNAVNVGLLAIGCAILLVFAGCELWLLHGRFEFVIVQLGSGGSRSRRWLACDSSYGSGGSGGSGGAGSSGGSGVASGEAVDATATTFMEV